MIDSSHTIRDSRVTIPSMVQFKIVFDGGFDSSLTLISICIRSICKCLIIGCVSRLFTALGAKGIIPRNISKV